MEVERLQTTSIGREQRHRVRFCVEPCHVWHDTGSSRGHGGGRGQTSWGSQYDVCEENYGIGAGWHVKSERAER